MPRRQPFTQLCLQMANLARPISADLHVHTFHSDGDFTPSQVVAYARLAGLRAIAITDHDTTVACAIAREAASASPSRPLEIVDGVEISTEYEGREYHLLGYFLGKNREALEARLAQIRLRRRERFHAYLAELARNAATIPADAVSRVEAVAESLGRRHLAGLLVDAQFVRTRHEAFRKYLEPFAPPTNHRVPIDEAIALIRGCGGVAALAHPPQDLTLERFAAFCKMGMTAIECAFPSATRTWSDTLREWAKSHDLATTGGSDCHGAEPASRRIGAFGINSEKLERLRERCRSPNV